jgi:hypothetical protein
VAALDNPSTNSLPAAISPSKIIVASSEPKQSNTDSQALTPFPTAKLRLIRSPVRAAMAAKIRPPHPSDLRAPGPFTQVKGYYLITKGQECGIFYNWYIFNIPSFKDDVS